MRRRRSLLLHRSSSLCIKDCLVALLVSLSGRRGGAHIERDPGDGGRFEPEVYLLLLLGELENLGGALKSCDVRLGSDHLGLLHSLALSLAVEEGVGHVLMRRFPID